MSVTDEAIEKIKDMIISGALRPGDRLPREADLARRLGLSRSSLREAVRALSLVRILDVRQGDGTYVTSLDAALLLDALSFVIELHQDRSVLELLEARRLLEAEAAALAAERREPEQIAELRALIEAMPACKDVEEFVENDMGFHRTIATAAGSYGLTRNNIDESPWPITNAPTTPSAMPSTVRRHAAASMALTTSDARAPRARRIAVSRRRWFT